MTFLRIVGMIMFSIVLTSMLFATNLPNNVQVATPTASVFQAANPSYQQGQVLYHLTNGDTVLWNEQWETGAPGWSTLDETDPGPKWHLDDWMAFNGISWWMADTTLGTNGGYDNEWYQVLDTDTIDLTGTTDPLLTFQHRYKCETPGGEPVGYDGWDGQNVRISTDGGATWVVLENPVPAYTDTSLYSFGFSHGEGLGIPGWCGEQATWTAVSVDLSAFTGQTVKIRFAFASDPGFSTPNDPSMFGWQIDDIEVADGANVLYSNDGTASGITPANNTIVGGDLWHVETGTGLPSGTHFADCNDPMSGTYNPNMNDSYISDYVWIPDTLSTVFYDFYLQGSYSDNDVFPDVDFFGAYVQIKGEALWRYISNITNDPNGNNYVYSSAPLSWAQFSQSYSTGLVDLSPLIGDSIRVKFTFESDGDTPMGTALQVDDVVIWSPDLTPPVGEAPENLSATAGDGVVDLMWDEMNVAGHQMFTYDDGSFENAIHLTSGTGDAGAYFDSPSEATIDTLWIWGYSAITNPATTLKIWETGPGGINASPTYTMPINLTLNQWNVIDLTSQNWVVSGNFVAGFQISVDMWIALDENTIPSAHSWVNLGGWQTWQSVAIANGLPDGEWGVRSSVTYTNPTSITYNVYRRLDTTPNYTTPLVTGLANAMYSDNTVTNGESYCYVTTAVYPSLGESGYSNEACASPQSSTIYEVSYDDGTPESFYNVGTGNYMAVKFTPAGYPTDIFSIMFYLQHGSGSIQLKVWDDDGANGLPGTELVTYNVSNVDSAWNTYMPTSPVTISDGSFYAGIRVAPTTPDLGLDETAPIDDMSYLKIGTGAWDKITNVGLNADAMIRVELDSFAVGIEDPEQLISEFNLLQNYPNPFNPETNITFSIPAELNGERVTLKIFDILGREVVTLFDETAHTGVYNLRWDGMDDSSQRAASGIYFYRIVAGKQIQTRKMVLMK